MEDGLFRDLGSRVDARAATAVTLLTGARLAGVRLLRRLGDEGYPSGRCAVQTWAEFTESLARAGAKRPRPLSRGGDDALLRQVAPLASEDGYFAPALGTAGLRRALLQTFAELAHGGFVDTTVITDTLSAVAHGASKLSDLARLYAAYRGAFAGRFADDVSQIEVAIENVRSGRSLPPANLYVHGFLEISPLGRQLLSACSDGGAITLLVPDRGTIPSRRLDELLDFGHSLGATRIALPDAEADHDLGRVRSRWFGPLRPDPDTPRQLLSGHAAPAETAASADGTLAIVAAAGGPREVRAAVGEVCAALGRGVPPGEIAVVFRHGVDYQRLVHETLDAAGVPHYLPAGLPADGSRVGRATLSLLGLAESDRRRRDVLDFFLLAPLRWEAFVEDRTEPGAETRRGPETSAWDRLAREAAIPSGAGQWPERLRRLRGQLAARVAEAGDGPAADWLRSDLEQLDLFERAVDVLFDHLDDVARPRPWRAAVAHLRGLLARLLRPGDDLTAVLEAIDGLGQLAGLESDDDPPSFFRAVSAAVSAATLRVGRFGEDVFVGDLTNMRGLSFRVVCLLGVGERVFPAPTPREPILDDHERRAINAVGRGRVAVRGDEAGGEELLFKLALDAARERLVLSYPSADGEGRQRLPSYFVLRAAEALTGAQLGPDELHLVPGFRRVSAARLGPDAPADAITPLEFDVAEVERAVAEAARTGDRTSARLGYLDRLSPDFARARAALAARLDGRMFGPHDGVFRDASARARLAERFGLTGRPLSATTVERYAVCPQRYFLANVLRLAVADEPEEMRRLSASERGQLVHSILERFYRELIAEGLVPLRRDAIEEYRARLHRVAEAAFDEWHARGVAGAPLVWEMDRLALLEDLEEWLLREVEDAEQTGFAPLRLEVSFGMPTEPGVAALPPARFPLDGGGVLTFRGHIDRVDATADGRRFRVIDYKTGRVAGHVKPNLLQGGRALQLPVYLRAAAGLEQLAPDADGGAEYYYVTRREGFRRVRFETNALERRRGDLEAILRAAATGVGEGRFFAYPGRQGRNCEVCDFTAVCDSRRLALFEQKRMDPAAADFLALESIE